MAVGRAHVARAVGRRDRTGYFAYLSAVQFVGFAVLPGAVGSVGVLKFNGLTHPGFALVAIHAVSIGALLVFYRDPVVPPDDQAPSPDSTRDFENNTNPEMPPIPAPAAPANLPSADYGALSACLLINVCLRGAVAQLETVTAPFLMARYSMGLSDAGSAVGVLGTAGLCVYLAYGAVARRVEDRVAVASGLGLLVLGAGILGQRVVALGEFEYLVGLGMVWALAYPIGQTAALALFSKKVGGLPVGGLLGVFSTSGSLARLVFAAVAGWSWNVNGEDSVFRGIFGVGLVALISALSVFKRLKN